MDDPELHGCHVLLKYLKAKHNIYGYKSPIYTKELNLILMHFPSTYLFHSSLLYILFCKCTDKHSLYQHILLHYDRDFLHTHQCLADES